LNKALAAAAIFAAGAAAGYAGAAWTHSGAPGTTAVSTDLVRGSVVACTLSPDQIDRLSAHIAPAVVERMASAGLNSGPADPKVAAQQRAAIEKSKVDGARAMTEATDIVDEMIRNHDVTLAGMVEARRLLESSGQADRTYELYARVSAAINRGDITPAQAGLVMPEH